MGKDRDKDLNNSLLKVDKQRGVNMIEKTFTALKNTFLKTSVDRNSLKSGEVYTMKFKNLGEFQAYTQLGIITESYKPVEIPIIPKVEFTNECDVCGVNLIYTGILKEDDMEYKVHTCPVCKQETKELTEESKEKFNAILDEVETEESEKKQFVCEKCGKMYVQEKRFLNHRCNESN